MICKIISRSACLAFGLLHSLQCRLLLYFKIYFQGLGQDLFYLFLNSFICYGDMSFVKDINYSLPQLITNKSSKYLA